jgi:hypothetical protein
LFAAKKNECKEYGKYNEAEIPSWGTLMVYVGFATAGHSKRMVSEKTFAHNRFGRFDGGKDSVVRANHLRVE